MVFFCIFINIFTHYIIGRNNMTQKELLYYEDAVSHEDILIKICEDAVTKLEDEKLITLMQQEINRHNNLKNMLMNKLEGVINE